MGFNFHFFRSRMKFHKMGVADCSLEQANGGESTVISKFSVVSSPDDHALWVKRPSGILRAISGHRKFQPALIEDGQSKMSSLMMSL